MNHIFAQPQHDKKRIRLPTRNTYDILITKNISLLIDY